MSAVENVPLAEELAALVRHGYTAGHVANRFGIEVADTESWLRALDRPYPCAPFFGRSGGCERCPGFARCREHDQAGLWVLCEMPRPDQVARAVLEGKYEPPDGYRPAWLPVLQGEMTMDEIVQYLDQSLLAIHPRNMRRIYPADQVRQMAESIQERGVIQPLIAVRADPEDPESILYVVAGNLRLAGIRALGEGAPAVPVIVRERDAAEQLLDMAAENIIRFDPDPVSEGLHYKSMLQFPGMTKNRLHELTGISSDRIKYTLVWTELEPEIQELAIHGQLPKLAGRLLVTVPPGKKRVDIAIKLAAQNATLEQIEATCNRFVIASRKKQLKSITGPMGRAVALATFDPANGRNANVDTGSPLRAAVAEACHQCPNRDDLGVPEPAWSILSHGAQETCDTCSLQHLREYCNNCPLVTCLRYAYRTMARQEGLVPHEAF